MDFFEHQERARRKTFHLVVYYAIAVCLIILSVYAIFAFVLLGDSAGLKNNDINWDKLWDLQLFLGVIAGTLAVVVLGSVYKIVQLSAGGGKAVASMLGGQPISQTTTNPDEKKILNIVEEMAIASGLPVPPVYLLSNEPGINAFAAGFSPNDAVIGVTQGCITNLKRDELQGVIAHEFSHILNGDMRMNIKLIGILNGILVIALIGYTILRMTATGKNTRSSSSKDKKGGNPLPLIGLGLMIIGYIGVFFGNLIKAAISRQREFLADASAVQFTRNPSGISGALKKIGGFSMGSGIASSKAQEASHMFFANGLTGFFAGLFATHPPIDERVRRIEGSFDGELKDKVGSSSLASAADENIISGLAQSPQATARFSVGTGGIAGKIGAMTPEHVNHASSIMSQIPDSILDMAREQEGAQAVILSILLDEKADIRNAQLSHLNEKAGRELQNKISDAYSFTSSMWPGLRLPLVDLAVPALKTMPFDQYQAFTGNLTYLVEADNQVRLFEYAIMKIINRSLDITFGKTRPSSAKQKTVRDFVPKIEELLSCLAWCGTGDENTAEKAFKRGSEKLPGYTLSIHAAGNCSGSLLDKALDDLALAPPSLRRQIVEACMACAAADNEITIEEAELVRAVSITLNCPISPFLPGGEM